MISRNRSASNSSLDSSDLYGVPVNLRRENVKEDTEAINYSDSRLDNFSLELQFKNIQKSSDSLNCLNLSNNQISFLPTTISNFQNLSKLDLSKNFLERLNSSIMSLPNLTVLLLTNNNLDENSFPKDFGSFFSDKLKVLSLSGNRFRSISSQIFQLSSLRSLYLGGNRIQRLSPDIANMQSLRFLYLGGNELTEIPEEIGQLKKLEALSLCENKLTKLPSSIANLNHLKSLNLHKNLLTTLPAGILQLNNLTELSLRNNPLVVQFIRDLAYDPPTLLELSARCVKIHNIPYDDLPTILIAYLATARSCVNPKCKGVYFDAHAEHVKFVDFCGVYRVPLMQYLCSASCSSSKPAHHSDENVSESKLKKVLLG